MLDKFKNVQTFVFDMDGVLTDGTLLVMESALIDSDQAKWIRVMHVKDGYALQLAAKKGYNIIVLSGSTSEPVKQRLRKLGISNVFFGVRDKKTFLVGHFQKNNLNPERALFMGDDIPDLEVMKVVGLRTCPADACSEIKEAAHYISPIGGGKGCVRDVIEKVLKLNNNWDIHSEIAST